MIRRLHLRLLFNAIALALSLVPFCSGQVQGPFTPGHQVFTAVDSNRDNRELLTDVWYPVDEAGAVGQPPLQYYQHYNDGADFWWYESPFLGGVQDAVASDAGPFPLIVLSHGWRGWPGSFHLLGESLASHGYVVAAPRHTGNAWGTPNASNSDVDVNRPVDISFTTNEVIARSADAPDPLFGAVDSTRIALGGYSYGVPTIVGTITGIGPNSAAVPADPRARAALFIDQRAHTLMELPLIHVGGADDDFASIPLRATEVSPLYGFDVDNVHHWSFGTNICQYRDALIAANAPPEVFATTGSDSGWPGCAAGLIDPREAQELLAQQAVAFFDAHLAGDEFVEPDLFPRIQEIEGLLIYAELSDIVNPPNSLPFEVLLVDPLGRRLGIDPETHAVVNDFATGSFTSGSTRHTFSIEASEVVAGEYVVVGSAMDPTSGAELEIQQYVLGLPMPHERNARLRFDRMLTPNQPIDEVRFQVFAARACDFNEDGVCGISDLNTMLSAGPLSSGIPSAGREAFDLTGDGIINNDDVDEWLSVAASGVGLSSAYKRADANLDGVVDGADFILWNEGKFTETKRWDAGDFNGDGVADGADFIVWNANKFTSSDLAAAVPEPGAAILCIATLLLLTIARPRFRRAS